MTPSTIDPEDLAAAEEAITDAQEALAQAADALGFETKEKSEDDLTTSQRFKRLQKGGPR